MAKNVRVRKSMIALGLAATIGLGSYKVYDVNETNRVKGYLNDLVTDGNYVDFTRVSHEYDIRTFDGKYLRKALESSDIDYVIVGDSIVYDGSHVGTFKYVDYVNGNIIGYDDFGNPVYESLNAVVNSSDGHLTYDIPEGYELRETTTLVGNNGPVRYSSLDNYEVNVHEDMGAYGISLRKHK